ncbi:hypothetical protein BP5796_04916 [Coleophoma crateriformis]|uniref:Thioesterase/thiol ester dehydrase-isomerase n=1 Tax=Coleophoma crateriformis TaxID=565419 RepID=A0A3D8SAR7_9HELO|nr:hypothetical protein BP5796_04916 [Coleophoma crateriformis]
MSASRPFAFLLPRGLSACSVSSLRTCTPTPCFTNKHLRQSSTASARRSSPSKWLGESKERIGKCLKFGTDKEQTQEAADMLATLGREWRQLVAGGEGFVTRPGGEGMLRQRVVWGDMDSMSHVNNVAYNRYAESGRIEWIQHMARFIASHKKASWNAMWTPKGDGLILKTIRTDFKFVRASNLPPNVQIADLGKPMTWPDHVSVYHRITEKMHDLGEDPEHSVNSFKLQVLILSEKHQRPAAKCSEEIVFYDYQKKKPRPLYPFMIEAFDKLHAEQESAERSAIEKMNELDARILQLEKQTWDREDAVEDMGGSR